jgi:DNA-binding PadR family transcriptional regulator
LYHAQKKPFFGAWMIEELKEHGYQMSPGTLYPILHNMESNGLLKKENKIVKGKVRKYYSITAIGKEFLEEARKKAFELFEEIKD